MSRGAPVHRLSVLLISALISQGAFAQGKVSAAGSLTTGRVAHTATLLADGRVLVVGGRSTDALAVLGSAELYTPKSKSWALAGALASPRVSHTATLLKDGRVLVVGGSAPDAAAGANRFVALASAELYDPKRNTWSAAAPLKLSRNNHTATLLKDGRVLVAGGIREQRSILSSVELYDPATNSWSDGAPLSVPRWQHDAVRLPSGAVVIVGGRSNRAMQGQGSGISIADCERYDAAQGKWVTLPPLNEPLQRFAALALDETVLVVGGQTTTGMTNYVEVLTPEAAAWTIGTHNLSAALASATATPVTGGEVVVAGGEVPNAVDTRRVQRWDSQGKRWCLAGELTVSRKGHTATALPDGTVLIAGGTSAGVPEASAELWLSVKGKCEEPPGSTGGLE